MADDDSEDQGADTNIDPLGGGPVAPTAADAGGAPVVTNANPDPASPSADPSSADPGAQPEQPVLPPASPPPHASTGTILAASVAGVKGMVQGTASGSGIPLTKWTRRVRAMRGMKGAVEIRANRLVKANTAADNAAEAAIRAEARAASARTAAASNSTGISGWWNRAKSWVSDKLEGRAVSRAARLDAAAEKAGVAAGRTEALAGRVGAVEGVARRLGWVAVAAVSTYDIYRGWKANGWRGAAAAAMDTVAVAGPAVVGGEIGSAIGAAVGSIIPGAGTLVGGVVGGLVGGWVGGWFGEKHILPTVHRVEESFGLRAPAAAASAPPPAPRRQPAAAHTHTAAPSGSSNDTRAPAWETHSMQAFMAKMHAQEAARASALGVPDGLVGGLSGGVYSPGSTDVTPHSTDHDVYFNTGSSELNDEAKRALIDMANKIKLGDPGKVYELSGMTDLRGSASSNMNLAHQRALAVQEYLYEQGIDKNRLTIRDVGEQGDMSNYGANRHVTISEAPSSPATAASPVVSASTTAPRDPVVVGDAAYRMVGPGRASYRGNSEMVPPVDVRATTPQKLEPASPPAKVGVLNASV